MEKFYILVYLLTSSLRFTNGVRCLTCENAISNENCIEIGRLVDCIGDGIGCSSEVRYHAGFVFKIQIKKGCKQILACGSDKSQNGHGWYPVQCNPKFPDSICRCCCQTDDCNRFLIGCEPPQPDCRALEVPEYASKICNNEDHPTALRSICTFLCDEGFELRGQSRTECVLEKEGRAVWTAKEPRCIAKKCKPVYRNSAIMKVECSDKNIAGSVCEFNCVDGYIMNGEPRSTCLLSKNWDYPPPDCVKITCPPPINPPAYSVMHCTDGFEFGSVCNYTCMPGYEVFGDRTRRCVLGSSYSTAFGEWSGSLPQCLAIACHPKLNNPQQGQVECTDMNMKGSTCSYLCMDGHTLEGSATTKCTEQEDGNWGWSHDPPVCKPIRCPEIEPMDTNGYVSCSNMNNIGSMCAFACNEGAYIKGITKRKRVLQSLVLSCLRDGTWSEEMTSCAKILCYPDYSTMSIENGGIDCTDANSYRSECNFFCNDGYDLKGGKKSTCKDGKSIEAPGVWTIDLPRCIRTGCNRIANIDLKLTVSCTNKYLFGSTCRFQCKEGYYMASEQSPFIEENDYTIECKTDRHWTASPPVCKQIRCLPETGALSNGFAECSNKNIFGSRCSFFCNVAYGLVGSSSNQCKGEALIDGNGQWTTPKPVCVRNGCAPKFTAPEGGKMTCSNKNLFKSACEFTCRDGYYMASHDNYLIEENSLISRCTTEGDWAEIPPTCHKIVCEPLDMVVDNGAVNCTDENNFKSECTYTCNEGYELNKKNEKTKCTGKLTSDAYGLWSQEDLRCIRATCTVRQRAPAGGKVACSSGNGVGSDCIFVCYDGHYMNTSNGRVIYENTFRVKCLRNKIWTQPAPRCLPVTCPVSTIKNGNYKCSNENFFASKCQFSCAPGYMRVGPNSTVCRADGDKDEMGQWLRPWPECKELGCDPDYVTMPKNGFVLCSDGAKIRSTCEFVCDVGYRLIGSQFSVCKKQSETEVSWTKQVPECVKGIK